LARPARIAVAVLCIGASAHLVVVNRFNLSGVFNQAPFDTRFRWMAGPREIATDKDSNAYVEGSPMLRALVEHRAFFYCYESLQLLRASDPEKPRLFTEGTVRISDVDFSPNRVSFNVFGGPERSKVLLNYNWGPGWSSTAGPIELVGDRGKLPTVSIAPGQTGRYEFSFTPPGLYLGTAVFVVAVLLSIGVWRRRTRPVFVSGAVAPPRPEHLKNRATGYQVKRDSMSTPKAVPSSRPSRP
jgi:hypothetical protein